MDFQIHHDFKNHIFIQDFNLSRLMMTNDSQFPWFILIPRRSNCCELFDLADSDFKLLCHEVKILSIFIKKTFHADKINVATLGNITPQLHLHIIARRKNDIAWPKPIWNAFPPIPYSTEEIVSIQALFTNFNYLD